MRPCQDRHPEPKATAAACRLCHLAVNDSRYQRLWDLPVAAPGIPGPPVKRVRYCSARKVWDWSVTAAGRVIANGSEPSESEAHAEADAAAPPEAGAPRIDQTNLWPGVSGLRFNPSVLPFGDGYLFACRTGWAGSQVVTGYLDRSFQPTGPHAVLNLTHPAASYGREDPRLFAYRNRPHVMYTGVVGPAIKTNVLYARLAPDGLGVERVFYPEFAGRAAWEKNWVMWEADGDLWATYSYAPHRVLRIDGDRAEGVYLTDARPPWQGGEVRGGACPVRVGAEFWHFFHDRVEASGLRVYRAGLLTTESVPPFRVLRVVPEPIAVADPTDKPPDQYAAVLWPGGAVRDGDVWTLAMGVHDRWSELHRFSHADLERQLVRVSGPGSV